MIKREKLCQPVKFDGPTGLLDKRWSAIFMNDLIFY